MNSPTTQYADDQIEQMRVALANYWVENLEGEVLSDMLLHGCGGYNEMSKETLIEEFEFVFGDNYFWDD